MPAQGSEALGEAEIVEWRMVLLETVTVRVLSAMCGWSSRPNGTSREGKYTISISKKLRGRQVLGWIIQWLSHIIKVLAPFPLLMPSSLAYWLHFRWHKMFPPCYQQCQKARRDGLAYMSTIYIYIYIYIYFFFFFFGLTAAYRKS